MTLAIIARGTSGCFVRRLPEPMRAPATINSAIAPGKNRRSRNPDQSSKMHIFGVTVVHAEIRARRTGCGEESDDAGTKQADDGQSRHGGSNFKNLSFLRGLFT